MSEAGRAPIGRGGRGAAILQALMAARRPGEAAAAAAPAAAVPAAVAAPPQPAQPTPAADSGLAPPTAVIPRGRADRLMASLLQARPGPSFSAPAPPVAAPVTAPTMRMPFGGRGRALIGAMASPASSTTSNLSAAARQMQLLEVRSEEDVRSGGGFGDGSDPVSDKPMEAVHFRGSEGQPIPCNINHVRIRCKKGCNVHEYAVLFNPDVDSRNVRFKLLNQHREIVGPAKSFDGAKLYIPKKFPEKNTVLQSKHPITDTVVQVTLRYIAERKLNDCVQLFNMLFRRVMDSLELVQIGRQCFDPNGSVQIPKHNLEMWPGYITAINDFEGGLMLAAETSHRVLRTQTVLQQLYELRRRCPDYKDEAMKKIVGNVILTRYNKKTYRIDDIMWDKSPRSTFETRDGPVTYHKYYKDQYNEQIQDLDQPLLLHLAKKRPQEQEGQSRMLCMIPELSYLTGLTDEMRSDFHVMKDIGMTTRLSPSQRQFQLLKLVNGINNNPQARAHLDPWGFEIVPEPVQVEGRLFKEEQIFFRRSGPFMAGQEANWSRGFAKNQVLSAVDLNRWVVFYTNRDHQRTHNFVEMMMKVCPMLGMAYRPPLMVKMDDDRITTLTRDLRQRISPEMQLVVVVNPTARDDRYSLIKKVCCVDNPIPSQVINGRTIDNQMKLRSVTQNIALQINCKLGGELWEVKIPIRNLMIVGVDVFHDAAANRKKSVLGFVASMSRSHTRWYSRATMQMPGQELGSGLEMCMVQCLTKYHEVNHDLPEKIVVFRDGVGDGQLDVVEKTEVEQLAAAFKSFQGNYSPILIFIVVQKRINTRIFASYRNNLENPPPGTVIDQVVTKKYWKDFFLVSQHVRQGTVTPTHYVVIRNDSKYSPDQIQMLTYKMTHMYYNWPGTIRVPAPCQYAHKLAAIIGEHIHAAPSEELCDRLFFL